ncbi:MAG: DNA-directed RNA polymerase subunit omega [Deltaproteobacteria bacterium RIFCSPLOWO2_12_FULL_40_28]|nr:MAG: DNA-directed RNA polymerase subunit omega [Deltaproteobacteria bacterium RIFCSPHIGHO2_02_FULL_40_28]OGQ19721.1 MAG: DNA-directed RNA polymerase subunit omega [Deltaproteobacteria bacterium RIFCSPHIGHO2_12_FULL_40_32]OGQ40998.1 MAG: DNA-directed RNA polymerase subunit omega [Deltaproteobacteria bacterium RIFCSPLOWO2_02_FULL_40_36]OGQ54114.1 MAG: DNA-directed RNA polymerase subunit omega [Deltaproteobacteria bacterium RIFCSPLOWO2_12_FULL_40_28]
MARVTVEDCLEHIGNRFTLVHMTAKRVRQLEKGAKRLVGSKNKNVVESLREIADSKVRMIKKKAE